MTESDPLADLLVEKANDSDYHRHRVGLPPASWLNPQWEAEWLRANRERVLRALGGKVQDRRVELRDHTIATSWLFPLEGDRKSVTRSSGPGSLACGEDQ